MHDDNVDAWHSCNIRVALNTTPHADNTQHTRSHTVMRDTMTKNDLFKQMR